MAKPKRGAKMLMKLLNYFKLFQFELAGGLQKLEKEVRAEWEEKVTNTFDKTELRYELWVSEIVGRVHQSKILFVLTAPFIYALWFPALIMDFFITVYQKLCFPIYGIPLVIRNDFIVLDRYRLPYLNKLEKFNCFFCGYFNGLIAYTREVASRTEQYWCPIKHSKKLNSAHDRYKRFYSYGDSKSYRQDLGGLQKKD